MAEIIQCPKCNSTNWRCWDERSHWWEDGAGDMIEYPVGYLKCKDCGHDWAEYPEMPEEFTYRGDTTEAWGDDDEW